MRALSPAIAHRLSGVFHLKGSFSFRAPHHAGCWKLLKVLTIFAELPPQVLDIENAGPTGHSKKKRSPKSKLVVEFPSTDNRTVLFGRLVSSPTFRLDRQQVLQDPPFGFSEIAPAQACLIRSCLETIHLRYVNHFGGSLALTARDDGKPDL